MIGYFLISGVGIVAGYHRYFAHGVFKMAPWKEKIVTLLGLLGGQGSPIFWTAIHRGYHHRFSDTERDIHSPKNGKWMSYIGWVGEVNNPDINYKYAGPKLLRDPFQIFVNKYYYSLVWFMIIIFFIIAGPWLTFSIIVAPMLMAAHMEYSINLFCHLKWFGYRNFDTKDDSVNSPLLGLLVWGDGFHNTHHHNPGLKYNDVRKFEFDLCRLIIPVLED